MTVKPPGNLSHLERLIDTWSRSDDEAEATAGRLRRLVAVSVLASMLDALSVDGEPRLAFKGGASMELRFGPSARGSKDVDALVNIGFDDAFAEIAERLATGWEDFTGVLGDRTEITRAGITPAPQRCVIKLRYKTKPFASVPFELGRAEAGSFSLIEQIPNAIDMSRVQLGPMDDVAVLGVHYQIAQKLHACTEIPNEGANPRAHDLYDIMLIADLARADSLNKTLAACVDTFTYRNKHAWPPALTDWPDWPAIWDGLDLPDTARITYHEARAGVTALIAEITKAQHDARRQLAAIDGLPVGPKAVGE